MKYQTWVHPWTAFSRVHRFVNSLKSQGWTVEVFIDAVAQTEEAKEKWTWRREKEVTAGKRNTPQASSVMLGEMYKKVGIPVHYSVEADNDDTLVAHAVARDACIMSGDNDMHRYIYPGKRVTVFPGFSMDKGEAVIKPPKLHTYEGEMRNLIVPPPKTTTLDPSFVTVARDRKYVRGTPSPLTRYYGNAHLKVRPLRQALYTKLGIKEGVLEVFPDWDATENKVRWVQELVLPDPAYLHLLEATNFISAFNTFFKPSDIIMPPGAPHKPELWYNHVYAMWAVVAELVSVASQEPMFELLSRTKPFNHIPRPQEQHPRKRNPRETMQKETVDDVNKKKVEV